MQFHKKYPENISLHQPDKFLLLWVNNKNKSETVFLVPSQNHSYNSTMYTVAGYRPFTVRLQLKTLLPCILLLTAAVKVQLR